MEMNTVAKTPSVDPLGCLIPRQTCGRSVVNTLRPVRRTGGTRLLLVGEKWPSVDRAPAPRRGLAHRCVSPRREAVDAPQAIPSKSPLLTPARK